MRTPSLDQTFSALADPTRRAIVERLLEGEALVKDLAEPFEMSLPAVIKHVDALERAGLVSRRREAQRKPISLNMEPLEALSGWLETYRAHWEANFQRLEAVVADDE